MSRFYTFFKEILKYIFFKYIQIKRPNVLSMSSIMMRSCQWSFYSIEIHITVRYKSTNPKNIYFVAPKIVFFNLLSSFLNQNVFGAFFYKKNSAFLSFKWLNNFLFSSPFLVDSYDKGSNHCCYPSAFVCYWYRCRYGNQTRLRKKHGTRQKKKVSQKRARVSLGF